MNCAICGQPLKNAGGGLMTCVGYFSPPGHDHDDNCWKRSYVCENGHRVTLSVRRSCPAPGCNWKGKEKCFCHKGPKLDAWPEEKEEKG
jgi:hypothetical protein